MNDKITRFLDDISSRTELRMFFEELFKSESKLPVLLFLHKNDLFPSIEEFDINLPILFWINDIVTQIEPVSFFITIVAHNGQGQAARQLACRGREPHGDRGNAALDDFYTSYHKHPWDCLFRIRAVLLGNFIYKW